MNQKAVKVIFISLILAVFGRVGYNIYKEDNCEYQMAKVKTSAYADLEFCPIENRPLKIRIANQSSYDLVEYSFSVGAYRNKHNKAVSSDGYTDNYIMPRGGELTACFAIPEVKGVSNEDIKKGYNFKVNFSRMEFDTGNGKRLVCN